MKIGPYTITRTLGRGGMGVVYRAVIPSTGKAVALKQLQPAEPLVSLLGETKLLEIFSGEAKAMTGLHHPNIVRIFDINTQGEQPYYTMEYFCNNIGTMLGEQETQEPSRSITSVLSVFYAKQVLAGLKHIHRANMIHRDLKPDNLLVTDHNKVKIGDFGMAKHQFVSSFSSEGMHIGSPFYSAPEQIQDPDWADERSDLYSVAVLLHSMLTGELPGMESSLNSRNLYLSHHAWNVFFNRALNPDPDKRYQSADEMAQALGNEALFKQEGNTSNRRIIACDQKTPGDSSIIRSTPIRASGTTAMKLFSVDNLWQPTTIASNCFIENGGKTLLDKANGLCWQLTASDYPVDRQEAEMIIETLNDLQYDDIASWRLPTVNELLTLVNNPALAIEPDSGSPFPDNLEWLWSCDSRTKNSSWYVHTGLGYVGWQDENCRYYVRAVSSFQPESVTKNCF